MLAVAGNVISSSRSGTRVGRQPRRLADFDVRARLFEDVQNLPSAYFARTRRGQILSRFSVDLSAIEGAIKSFANSAALPFLELIAGIVLMLPMNWQLAAVALLVFPITLIGPRILTPKAVQANYEQKLNEWALLGMVQENVAAQAVIKAFNLQRRTFGWFTMRNDDARRKIAAATFLSTMVERTVTISVPSLHLCGAGPRRLSRHQGPDHHRYFRDVRERVLGSILQHRPHHAFHPGIRSSRRRRSATFRRCWTSRPAAPTARARPDLPRITNDITFDRVTLQYEGSLLPVSDFFEPQAPGRATAPPLLARAAPARARCST